MKVVCEYCGLPFRTLGEPRPEQHHFCCVGCAIASRVPVDAQGQFPVNGALISAVVTGFVYFNQVFCLLMSGLLARNPADANADRFALASIGIGVVLTAGLIGLHGRMLLKRWPDIVMAVVALAGIAHAVFHFSPLVGAVMNGVFVLWLGRGFWLGKRVRKAGE